jgi:hypothetical protein
MTQDHASNGSSLPDNVQLINIKRFWDLVAIFQSFWRVISAIALTWVIGILAAESFIVPAEFPGWFNAQALIPGFSFLAVTEGIAAIVAAVSFAKFVYELWGLRNKSTDGDLAKKKENKWQCWISVTSFFASGAACAGSILLVTGVAAANPVAALAVTGLFITALTLIAVKSILAFVRCYFSEVSINYNNVQRGRDAVTHFIAMVAVCFLSSFGVAALVVKLAAVAPMTIASFWVVAGVFGLALILIALVIAFIEVRQQLKPKLTEEQLEQLIKKCEQQEQTEYQQKQQEWQRYEQQQEEQKLQQWFQQLPQQEKDWALLAQQVPELPKLVELYQQQVLLQGLLQQLPNLQNNLLQKLIEFQSTLGANLVQLPASLKEQGNLGGEELRNLQGLLLKLENEHGEGILKQLSTTLLQIQKAVLGVLIQQQPQLLSNEWCEWLKKMQQAEKLLPPQHLKDLEQELQKMNSSHAQITSAIQQQPKQPEQPQQQKQQLPSLQFIDNINSSLGCYNVSNCWPPSHTPTHAIF